MQVDQERPDSPPASVGAARTERLSALSQRVQSLRMPESIHASRAPLAWVPWLLCVILSASTAGLGYLVLHVPARSETSDPPVDSAPGMASQADGKATLARAGTAPAATTVANRDKKIALESKGYIIAAHQILISPKVSGVVTRLTIEEGMRVKKGDVLAEIEDVDYRTDHERAVATCESLKQQLLELERGNRPEEKSQARAQLQESEAQLESLEADWNRMQELRKNKVASPADYDSAKSKFFSMQRQVERLRFASRLMDIGPRQEKIDAARAQLHDAQANVEKTQWKLDNCKIRAPLTGTILKKNAEEGNLVNAIAFSGSVSLCEMADLSDLEVDLTVQERDISHVFKGQKCKIRAEAFPDRAYDGIVSRLMPIADRSKGAISVRVKLSVPRDEEGVYLKPEMGAIVTFFGEADTPKPKNSIAAVPERRTKDASVDE